MEKFETNENVFSKTQQTFGWKYNLARTCINTVIKVELDASLK